MRLKNKVIRFIRFFSDNAKGSAQRGRSDKPEGRLTVMSDNRGSTVVQTGDTRAILPKRIELKALCSTQCS